MKKKITIYFLFIVILFASSLNIGRLKNAILIPKMSLEKQTSYTYMTEIGTILDTGAGTAQTDMVYELLLAISNKYGEATANTYYSCMQAGSYEAYYSAIKARTPSYKEGFVYSTNGMKQVKCGCQIVEQYLSISGLSSVSELIQAASNAGYGADANGIKSYIHAVKTGTVSKNSVPDSLSSQDKPKASEAVSVQPDPTSDTKTKSETESEKHKEAEKKKEISHGLYDAVSDEAEKAFEELLSDGVDDSCYIKVKADAEDRVVNADTVSKTLSNKEDGKIEFYSKGENDDYSKFSYSVKFPQVEVKEDVDLAATYAELDTSKYENVYQLAFVTEQILPSEVEITMNVSGTQGEKYYLLKGKDDSDYNTFSTADCDDKGCITFKTSSLDTIIISKTDIVSIREAEEAAKKAEQEAVEKEVKSEEALASASTEIDAKQSNEGNTENSGISTVMMITAGMIAIILIVAGIVGYRKTH